MQQRDSDLAYADVQRLGQGCMKIPGKSGYDLIVNTNK
jgi:hypothetical protein